MQPSPLTQAGTWDLVADDYAAEIAPVFETYARAALELSGIGADSRVVDVATGPGTLALLAAEGGAQVEALDFSARMIAQLEARARARRLAALSARVGDGMALPYPDASFDAGFSMFGLMFFPDRARGFAELARVLVPGARAVVSSWLPLDTLPLMKATFSLLTELAIDGSPPPPAPPGGMPMTSPDACRSEMEAGPFGDVAVHEVVAHWDFTSVQAMITSFSGSSAPVALTKQRLAARWSDVEAELVRRLTVQFGEGPQRLSMTAYLTVGVRR